MTGVAAPVLDRSHTTIVTISVIIPSEQSQPATRIPAVIVVARAFTAPWPPKTLATRLPRVRWVEWPPN
ncbi:hypothetical protein ACFTZI_04900 [Streptomyces decoyicus]|uniref:hypothetical protein n=1 Tax=Streptomyces decoyicus TaxID=249567 RepID=UPI00363A2EC6